MVYSMATETVAPRCPECGGRMVRIGMVRVNRAGDRKQNWVCTLCRRKTLNPVMVGDREYARA